jgi:hypothetical protein
MKLIPENHVQLFRDLLALAGKHNVTEFHDSDGEYCGLTIDNVSYLWNIEGDTITIHFDFPNVKAEQLAQDAFVGEIGIVHGDNPGENVMFMQAGASYWATIEITKDTVKEFAHCSAWTGTDPPYTRETRTKELK